MIPQFKNKKKHIFFYPGQLLASVLKKLQSNKIINSSSQWLLYFLFGNFINMSDV